jgi:ADP-ribose pyrophosphatase YjhB (NUDIX family)
MSHKVTVADEVTDLKRGVDHIGVSAVCLVHDGHGKILLMKRGPKARDEQGRWDACSGAIEFGESIDEAIQREISEELCAKTKEINFISVYDAHRVHDGNKTHWIARVYSVQVDPTTVKIGEPHKISEIGWFRLDNLPTPLHSQLPKAITIAKKRNILY